MKQITFRILDIMGRSPANRLSISELARAIKQVYKTSYYKNTYDEVKALQKQNILSLSQSGNASLASLNISYSGIIDIMAETEIIRKRSLSSQKAMLLAPIEAEFRKGLYFTDSIALISPEQNFMLNRLELLFIQRMPNRDETGSFDEKQLILTKARGLGKKYNIRIDCLILDEEEFISMLGSAEHSPLKAMLKDKIAFHSPQSFWALLVSAMLKGRQIHAEDFKKPSTEDIMHNMERFGYTELGWKIIKAGDFSIEAVITEALLKGNVRMVEAVPVLLAKNNISYFLLIFLCKNYNLLGKLLGLMSAMNKARKNEAVEKYINLIKNVLEEKEIKADEDAVRQKMELYNAD